MTDLLQTTTDALSLSLGLLAQVATAAPAAPGQGQELPTWLAQLLSFAPFILIIVIFYVFVFGARRKEQKQKQQMLSGMKKNDRIQTIGGLFGTVFEVRDDRVQIKVDESTNTKVWVARSAVHQVLDAEKAEKK